MRLFRRKRAKAEEAAKTAAAAAEAAAASNFEIGLHGTADQFAEAYEQVKGKREMLRYTDGTSWDDNRPARQNLLSGAVHAFRAGRVENVQVMLSIASTTTGYEESRQESYRFHDVARETLASVAGTGDVDNPAAVIELALAKVSAKEKQVMLDNTLFDAAYDDGSDNESFIAALLKAGADANAKIDGSAGSILAHAIVVDKPFSVIKLLHNHGASFDDAAVELRDYGSYDMENLHAHEAKIASMADKELIKQLQQNVADLTAKVEKLEVRLNPPKPRLKITPPSP